MRLPKPDFVYFMDTDGKKQWQGTIVFGWAGDMTEPPHEEPILELSEIEPIMDFMQSHFPSGWEIKDGKVVPH